MTAGALCAVTLAGLLVAAPADAATPKPTAKPTPSPTATPWPVGLAIRAQVAADGGVLTLPAGDGLRDRTTVRILAASGGRVDVDAIRGKKKVHLATGIALKKVKQGWAKTVAVDVSDLKAGTWRLRSQRSDLHGVWAWGSTSIRVGSGAATHVAVRPAARTLYPYRDGSLDAAVVTVVGQDETMTVVPVTGTVRIDAGRKHVTRKLSRAGTATLPVTALPLGAATLTTTVTGPAGKKAVRRTALTLAPTAVGALRVVRSADTVQPVRDGLLDSVVLTTSGTASGGSKAKVSGTLTIAKGKTVAATFPVKDGKPHAFTWNGRVGGTLDAGGTVVSGTWTVTLSLRGPQGVVRTRTTTLKVTKDHLPYAVRGMFTLADGNQQGLAVRNGSFYVGYDIGNDLSRIDVYDGTGLRVSSLGPVPIAHVAELAYSTVTGMLYAATGGAQTPTKVFVLDPTDPQWSTPTDPTQAIRRTLDYSGTLGNNAMVSVDDAGNRLLIFSGASGAYSISSATLQDSTDLDDAGNPKVPAGTITATRGVAIRGVPQGMDLVGGQLWIYTSLKGKNLVEKYDLDGSGLFTTAASTEGLLYWGGEGEGMATVQATDTGNGLPAWIFVGAHNPVKGGPNLLGQLVPVTAAD
ncbi:hypothetical protein [Amnibacterium setariae]|uniref:Uncharacterized protein n=1 Tax=Amnibacterium setariae TaxID=2306585 RepID=A0A3A1TWM9_9MICO|nr:hypothetical protein [Amnibacterium setariae]RIX26548.1 hypothetical protein D1781_16600 [Amnibacterium setariae]